jgi:uncharacterized protein involved in exopolysaccharide biosynthesis
MTKHEDNLFASNTDEQHPLTLRDIVQAVFRHKRAVIICFSALFVATILYCFVLPPKYESETKILIQKDTRLDPVMSTLSEQQVPVSSNQVSEEEINSEVEVILSDDVLHKVVASLGAENMKTPGIPNPLSWVTALFEGNDPRKKVAEQVDDLKHRLDVEPVKKSNVITITYAKRSPTLVTKVLRALDDVYLDKNMQVHRPSGQFEFFEEKTNDYRNKLAAAEDQLLKFSQAPGAVKPDMARDIALQKLSNFDATLHDTRALIASAQDRIQMLEKEQATVPERMTTSSRRLDNPELMGQMKNALLTLELKRTELLSKFQPDYRPVQEVEQEISKTKAAIAAENSALLRDDTTDVDPAHQWVDTELTKARADLKGLEAQATATEHNIREYEAVTHDLQNKEITAEDLQRDVKAAEGNYLLYLQKREEARIADALDKSHILNATVTEPPTSPILPKRSPFLLALIGLVASVTVSLGLAFTLDFVDSSFRTPREIEAALNLPVLAAVPVHDNRNGRTENGNGRPHADITELSLRS